MQTVRAKRQTRPRSCSEASLGREIRELLEAKVSGTLAGLWLLIPEHLRLGSWELLRSFRPAGPLALDARLCMQLACEAALCRSARQSRSLGQRGMELASGLPFLAADEAVHRLLEPARVEESMQLQAALARARAGLGHYDFSTLSIDPHRIRSHSRRQMTRRSKDGRSAPAKLLQSFFCFSAETGQPICMTIASPSRRLAQATPELLELAEAAMPEAGPARTLVLADAEHYISSLMAWSRQSRFDLLVPMPGSAAARAAVEAVPEADFTRHWAGYATAASSYRLAGLDGPCPMLVQRQGESEPERKGFLCTSARDGLEALASGYPKRWGSEEFFRHYQDMGWGRAGTMNLNARYAQMSLALVAQAAAHMLRSRLPEDYRDWNARHFADGFLAALDGDIRVRGDTIVVTYYNAPQRELLEQTFANTPARLQQEGVDPRVPWLLDFKLDFRFR